MQMAVTPLLLVALTIIASTVPNILANPMNNKAGGSSGKRLYFLI
jgi:hypothetical protein